MVLETRKEDLPDLRRQIEEATKSILTLAKARQNLSSKIALTKASQKLPIEDRQAESSLLDSMEEYAKRMGLDSKLAKTLTLSLIESSKRVQRSERYSNEIKSALDRRKIMNVSVIGAGRMGCWFASYFASFERVVSFFDRRTEIARKRANELDCLFTQDKKAIRDSDLIVLAVPMGEMGREIDFASSVTRNASKRVIEISSVKEEALRGRMGYRGLMSIHPLFGPSADHFSANPMIIVRPPTSASDSRFLEDIFPHFRILEMTASSHDKLISLMLTLPHLLVFIFSAIISKKVRHIPKGIFGPSFESFLEMQKRIFSENPRVYFDIQAMNKNNPEIFRTIEEQIYLLSRIFRDGNYGGFRKIFDDALKGFPA